MWSIEPQLCSPFLVSLSWPVGLLRQRRYPRLSRLSDLSFSLGGFYARAALLMSPSHCRSLRTSLYHFQRTCENYEHRNNCLLTNCWWDKVKSMVLSLNSCFRIRQLSMYKTLLMIFNWQFVLVLHEHGSVNMGCAVFSLTNKIMTFQIYLF